MRAFILWWLFFLGWAGFIGAQEGQGHFPYIDISGSFQVGIPVGDFRNNIDEAALGGGGSILIQLGRLPMLAGVSFGSQIYQSESLEYAGWVGGEYLNLKLRTRTNISMGHLVFRYQPLVDFPLWPYVDGLVGYHKVFTRTKLMAELDDNSYEVLESDTDRKEMVYSFGGALGVQLAVFKNPAIRIDLRCAYLLGGSAYYLVRDDSAPPPVNDPIEVFEPRYSATDVILPQIGLTLDLSRLFPPSIPDLEE